MADQNPGLIKVVCALFFKKALSFFGAKDGSLRGARNDKGALAMTRWS
jgi:hypothetical protein